MESVMGAVGFCMVVLVIAILASIIASHLVYRSMKQRTKSVTRAYVRDGRISSAGEIVSGDSMLSLDESIEVRGLIMRTIAPRPEELVVWAQRKWPNLSREELARKMVSTTAGKCGFIGFVTGAPGLFALPVTLPIDIVATGRLQASMIQALAYIYETDDDPDAIQRRGLMVMVGGGSLARSITRLSIKLIGPSLLKAVPVLGAIAGYAANYALAHVAGRVAIAHFSGTTSAANINRIAGETRQRLTDAAHNAHQRVRPMTDGASIGAVGLVNVPLDHNPSAVSEDREHHDRDD